MNKRLKTEVKKLLKTWRLKVANTLFAFDASQLQAKLAELGVVPGGTVMVHSSFDAFEGFQGKANDVVQLLQASVGSSGLLMMPTMGFTGSAIEHARSKTVFDVRRTPSRMGMLSELFRRTPGVLRSVHPTHPIACWGTDAVRAIEGHHLCGTPCGRGSPFDVLSQSQGRIVLLGTDISVLTFYHYLEEVFEAELPASPFTEEFFELQSKTANGQIVQTRTRLYEPSLSRRRNLYKLVPGLMARGAWREGSVGRLKIAVLQVAGIEAEMCEMNQRGVYCYD